MELATLADVRELLRHVPKGTPLLSTPGATLRTSSTPRRAATAIRCRLRWRCAGGLVVSRNVLPIIINDLLAINENKGDIVQTHR